MSRGSKQVGGEVLKQTGLELQCSLFVLLLEGLIASRAFPRGWCFLEVLRRIRLSQGKAPRLEIKVQRDLGLWVSEAPPPLCSLESDAALPKCPSPLHVSWEGGVLKLPPHPSDPGRLLLALLLGGRKISEAVETICFSHYLPNLLPQTISQRSWAHVGLQPSHLPNEPPVLGQRRFANEHAAGMPLSL